MKGELCSQNCWLDVNVHGHGDVSWYYWRDAMFGMISGANSYEVSPRRKKKR